MNEQSLAQHNVDLSGSGSSRLELLKSMEYDDFKNWILDTRNGLPAVERDELSRVDGFIATPNMTLGGKLYPRPQDKDELLEYALSDAHKVDNIDDAALILGAAIVYIHPFGDGNGRTSRTVYFQLSQGSEADVLDYARESGSADDTAEFGTIHTALRGSLLDQIVYLESGVVKLADQAWALSSDPNAARMHYGEREYHGLNEGDIAEFEMILGDKYGKEGEEIIGRYSPNADAVLFGISKFAQETGIDVGALAIDPDFTQVITPDLLASLDGNQKHQLLGYIRDYNSLEARAAIDAVAKYGDSIVNIEGYGDVSIHSLVLEATRNTVTSRWRPPKT